MKILKNYSEYDSQSINIFNNKEQKSQISLIQLNNNKGGNNINPSVSTKNNYFNFKNLNKNNES